VLDRDPAALLKKGAPNFRPMSGQAAASIKMPLGTEVGLGPDDMCMGTELPPPKKRDGAPSPICGPCLLWPNSWMYQDGTWHGGSLGPGHVVLDGDPAPSRKKGQSSLQIFGPFLLWPNGWMHQDPTWYGGRPQARRLCVSWEPSSPSPKRAEPPIFGPRLLWSNSCMDQDAT